MYAGRSICRRLRNQIHGPLGVRRVFTTERFNGYIPVDWQSLPWFDTIDLRSSRSTSIRIPIGQTYHARLIEST